MRVAPFQAVLPDLRLVTSTDHFFGTVKEDYSQYAAVGFFRKAARESLYVYRIIQDDRAHWGFVGAVHISEYLEGHIKKHELTLADKEQQQLRLLLERGAQVKPVLLAWQGESHLAAFAREWGERHEPVLDLELESEGSRHTLWAIAEGQAIRQVRDWFAEEVAVTYIADGHHRTSVMALLYEQYAGRPAQAQFEWLLAALFPADQLTIWDYNRVVDTRNEISFTRIMAALSQYCDIRFLEVPHKPHQPHHLTLFINNEWYELAWKPEYIVPMGPGLPVLDVDLFNRYVLGEVLGITDVRNDRRVSYVDGMKGLEGLKNKVLKNEHRIGFCLHPLQMEDFIRVSDAGQTLPPKSTWFEPRMKNGLIVKEIGRVVE